MKWFAGDTTWRQGDCGQREIKLTRGRHYPSWAMLLCALLFLVACSAEAEPTPTPDVPLLPTVAPTATATVIAVAAPSILPTVSAALVSPLPITNPITSTAPMTAAASSGLTATLPAATPVALATDCETEADIALASYPDLIALMGCAVQAASFDPVAINEFGPGPDYDRFMLWFSSENQIYVLLPSKVWERYPDTWSEEQETFSCNPLAGEPTSPPLPRRGFGKLWCSIEGLQATMGLVEREERLCQHTVTQPFQLGRLIACYEDATIRFFRVMDDGTWDQVLTR